MALAPSGTAQAQQQLPMPLKAVCGASTAADGKAACYERADPVFTETDAAAPETASRDPLSYFSDEPWTREGHPPRIGLALSGGGSKMAPFAIGVLKRFADQGWLERTDLISSVSGGSYAAYYLFSQAWAIRTRPELMSEHRTRSDIDNDRKRIPRITDLFADVRRESYGEYLGPPFERRGVYGPDEARYGRIDSEDGEGCRTFRRNSTRHQLYLECHQDILSGHTGGISDNIDRPPYGAYAKGALLTLLALPVHHLANTVFDWKLQLAPSQVMYREGIGRTYGIVPAVDGTPAISLPHEFGFAELQSLYDDRACTGGPCEKLPWWIIDTTNAVMPEDRRDLSKTVFEITPDSFGSGNYGYVRGASIDNVKSGFRPIDAVAASAAFFDSLSPDEQYSLSPRMLFVGLHAIDFRWGIEIPNYNVPDNARAFHSLLPWPLYYAHRFGRNIESTHIRLADGGQSGDNLGLISLLRRGTRTIVVADGSQDLGVDGLANLTEMCVASALLGKHGLELEFQGLPDDPANSDRHLLSDLCLPDGSGLRPQVRHAFSPYEWRRPVWEGTIRKSAGASLPPRAAQLIGIRVFYLKSAIDKHQVEDAIADWMEPSEDCNGVFGHNRAKYGLPCGIVGYRIDAGPSAPWSWPQTSTARTTANSSANRFEVYRDLGWYAAGKLACTVSTEFSDEAQCRISNGERPAGP
jgi:hypothetical protein